jgi:hypothetical protein
MKWSEVRGVKRDMCHISSLSTEVRAMVRAAELASGLNAVTLVTGRARVAFGAAVPVFVLALRLARGAPRGRIDFTRKRCDACESTVIFSVTFLFSGVLCARVRRCGRASGAVVQPDLQSVATSGMWQCAVAGQCHCEFGYCDTT